MRMVEVVKTFTRSNVTFKQGHKYVMAEDAESQWRSVLGDHLGMSFPIENIYRKYTGQDLTNKKLMVWRTGGIGDIFFLQPVLIYLKKKYPNFFLRVASGCKQCLENLPEVDELYDMPFDAGLLETVDYHLLFQGIIEAGSDASKRTHAVDMFYSYFNIDSIQFPPEDKKPKLVFTPEEMKWLKETNQKLGIKTDDYVIGIQLETSAPLRNFPKDKLKMIVDVLAKEEKVKIMLIGTPQQQALSGFLKASYTNVIPALNFSVREAMVLTNRYDLVMSPDSFMVQTAGALDKPLIGLYGPFPSEVRMKYFKNAIGIEPRVTCSPCFKHDFRACIKGYPSPCFTQVKPEDVLQAVDYQRFKSTKIHFKFMEYFTRIPDLSEVEKYMLSADKGLGFFCGYFQHHNLVRVDSNHFVNADITDLNHEFRRESFPFVLYMNDFSLNRLSMYHGSKNMVRAGGYLIVYKEDAPEQFLLELKQDIGKSFILLHSKYDASKRTVLIVGKKRY